MFFFSREKKSFQIDFSDEKAFDFSPWTAIVAKRPDAVACGFEGTYVTPKHHRDTDCYSLSIDCTRKHIMKVTAFSCETDAIFESMLCSFIFLLIKV